MQKGMGGNTVRTVWALVEPIAHTLGLEVWDICFLKEGSDWFLRIFIDKPEGIFISDCEALSKAIDEPLDTLDPIQQSYILEVCSPGVERELKRPEHFAAMNGKAVKVKLFRPDTQGRREIAGILKGYEDDTVILEQDAERVCIPIKDATGVRLDSF